MTRIIAGTAGSLRLQTPRAGTRPTSDRVRESLFSSLEAWNMLDDARVLDLYAGSGALGLEAVSRGAVDAVLVERHPPAAQVASRNAKTVVAACRAASREPEVTVHRGSAQAYLEALEPGTVSWDVVFVDPPYDLGEEALARNLAEVAGHLTEDAVVMVERDSRSPEPAWPAGLRRFKHRAHGETALWWAERADRPES